MESPSISSPTISPFGTQKNLISHHHSLSRPGSLSRPSSLSRPGSLSRPHSPLQPNMSHQLSGSILPSPIQPFEVPLPQDSEDMEMELHEGK